MDEPGRFVDEPPQEQYQRTLQAPPDWHAVAAFTPRAATLERVLDFVLAGLWAIALFVAGAALFW
jgi:hypothetical protein